jgi:hypothetical protein
MIDCAREGVILALKDLKECDEAIFSQVSEGLREKRRHQCQ